MQIKIILVFSIIISFALSNASAQNKQLPKTINGGVINGKATSLPKPAYPAAAQAVQASGEVKVQIVIDEAGNVISASAVSGHPLLRAAAESAARLAIFQPTTLSGQPVRVTGMIIYNFISPQPVTSNEEKLLIMGLGVFVTIADSIPDEEWESFPKEDVESIPQLAAELLPLEAINTNTSREKRAEIIREVKLSLENKLKGADSWQFEFGKNFGEILIDLKNAGTDEKRLLDESAIKIKLHKMKDAILSAPTDFPPDVLGKLKKVAEFADVQNLNADENKYRFVEAITATLETISPDSLD